MVDPLSLGAIAGVAITEGIKFLYNQAGAVLTRRAERKRAKKAGTAPPEEPIPVDTPNVVEGSLRPLTVDEQAADEHAEQLKVLRNALEDYALGWSDPSDGGPEMIRQTLALRDAIEDIVGQRITFRGEDRPPSGTPVVTGRLKADEIRGRAAGVDVGDMQAGEVHGELEAKHIGEGADAAGARIRNIGPGRR
jgi:hypothetical protein